MTLTPDILAEEDRREAAFLAAVEAQLQRRDPAEGAQAAQQIMDAVDAQVRKRWGTAAWVRRSTLGTVQSVDAARHRTRTTIPPEGAGASAPQTVKYGFGTARVRNKYVVAVPVRLPDTPTPLITGPVAAGEPWLKAVGSDTWIYYRQGHAVYRVPFPPADPTFAYTAEQVVQVSVDHGHQLFLNGVTTADSRWWTTEDSLRPINYGWQDFGVGVTLSVTRSPGVFLVGTATDPSLGESVLLGYRRRQERVLDPLDFFPGPYFRTLLDLVLSRDAGANWSTVRAGLEADTEIFLTNPEHLAPFPWERESVVHGQAFVLAVDGAWGEAGDLIAIFLTRRRDPDPFPDPTTNNATALAFFTNLATAESKRLTLYVSRNGGAAQRYVPNQTQGLIFSDGAIASGAIRQNGTDWVLWGEWQAHSVTSGAPPPFQIYRGAYVPGGAATWTAQPHQHVVSANTTGERVLAYDYSGGVFTVHFTADSGQNWLPLPLPPGASVYDLAGALVTDT